MKREIMHKHLMRNKGLFRKDGETKTYQKFKCKYCSHVDAQLYVPGQEYFRNKE